MTKNFTQTTPFHHNSKWNDNDRHAVCKLAMSLRSKGVQGGAEQAAKIYGCSHGSVYNWLGRLGYSQAYFNT